jgi:nucleoside-diphosphate-sugar epimerase
VAPARLISASADFGGSALRCIEADVRNADQVAEIVRDFSPEYTFHLAANASVPGSAENPRYDFESNATGTYNILEACRGLRGLRKIVVVSSGAVYGEPASFPITEASPLAPISPYGASKLVAETEARMFESAYSVPAVIARIFNTYGPRMPRFVVFDFLRKLQRNPDVLEVLGSGRQVRDLNYVTDTVAGLILLAEKGATGESYNLASGRHHNVTEIARELLDVLGLSGRTKLAFTGESWDGDAQRWEVDIGKLRQLGYEPEIGLKEGLRRVAAWFETVHGRLPRGDEES